MPERTAAPSGTVRITDANAASSTSSATSSFESAAEDWSEGMTLASKLQFGTGAGLKMRQTATSYSTCSEPVTRMSALGQSGHQKDRLAAVTGQPGHTDRPVQFPKVKLAFSFAVPAAISSTSSGTSKFRISSPCFLVMSIMDCLLSSLSLETQMQACVRVHRGRRVLQSILHCRLKASSGLRGIQANESAVRDYRSSVVNIGVRRQLL